ncbi:helix-turn-helix transcriptional regulator [Aequorivita echinoideorum]|uniref:HTH luxR-type domain-containing protein n=1 Tax=Aequorivita echinoideorum TaxID=1549647 RepID=A0ABS5S327_9FLAO|nr:hypothetical protein [Aequorivita echinoideorum]MBT0607609.1 hypothetical protein [Aequorivita echinoideorum]
MHKLLTLKSILMHNKCTTENQHPQHLIAGIQKTDSNIEFFGIHETMEVRFLQNGKTHTFNELKGKNAIAVIEAFEADHEAKKILQNITAADGTPARLSYQRMVELYIYFCYGSLDGTPDIVDGILSQPENYRHRRDCISLRFKHKVLRINGQALKPREVIMIDMFADDHKDDVVALELGITTTTLNQHKRSLFEKTGVQTKTALMIKAGKEGLIN